MIESNNSKILDLMKSIQDSIARIPRVEALYSDAQSKLRAAVGTLKNCDSGVRTELKERARDLENQITAFRIKLVAGNKSVATDLAAAEMELAAIQEVNPDEYVKASAADKIAEVIELSVRLAAAQETKNHFYYQLKEASRSLQSEIGRAKFMDERSDHYASGMHVYVGDVIPLLAKVRYDPTRHTRGHAEDTAIKELLGRRNNVIREIQKEMESEICG